MISDGRLKLRHSGQDPLPGQLYPRDSPSFPTTSYVSGGETGRLRWLCESVFVRACVCVCVCVWVGGWVGGQTTVNRSEVIL